MRSRLAAAVMALGLLALPPLATASTAQQILSVDPPPPPYEEPLLRLSEILGAIHYLRHLCDYDETETWREQMSALLDAEQPDEPRRARMIDRFNRGYEGFRSVYRTCTPAAAASADRYIQEGEKITTDITARYGK